jgi:hypothetical protein
MLDAITIRRWRKPMPRANRETVINWRDERHQHARMVWRRLSIAHGPHAVRVRAWADLNHIAAIAHRAMAALKDHLSSLRLEARVVCLPDATKRKIECDLRGQAVQTIERLIVQVESASNLLHGQGAGERRHTQK